MPITNLLKNQTLSNRITKKSKLVVWMAINEYFTYKDFSNTWGKGINSYHTYLSEFLKKGYIIRYERGKYRVPA